MRLLVIILFFCSHGLVFGQAPKLAKIDKLIDKGQYEKANKAIVKQLATGSHPQLHYLHGYCLSQLGQLDKAVAAFDASIALDPGDPQVYFDRAHAYFMMGQSGQAIADFTNAIQLDLNFAEAYLNRGTVKFEQGDHQGACDDWYVADRLGLSLVKDVIADNCDI